MLISPFVKRGLRFARSARSAFLGRFTRIGCLESDHARAEPLPEASRHGYRRGAETLEVALAFHDRNRAQKRYCSFDANRKHCHALRSRIDRLGRAPVSACLLFVL